MPWLRKSSRDHPFQLAVQRGAVQSREVSLFSVHVKWDSHKKRNSPSISLLADSRDQQDPECRLCKRLVGPIIFLSWSGLVWKSCITYGFDQQDTVNNHWHGDGDRTKKQPGNPRASLLLTSEKAVFCNIFCCQYFLLAISFFRRSVASFCCCELIASLASGGCVSICGLEGS